MAHGGGVPRPGGQHRKTGPVRLYHPAGQTDGLLGPAGTKIPAHEFHYWDTDTPGSAFRAEKPQSTRGWDCAYHTPTLYAGFPHFHFCAARSAAQRFVAAARRCQNNQEALS